MEVPKPQEKERPDWVWFLLILYGFGVLISFAIILFLLFSPKSSHLDIIGLGIALVVMVLRGIGLVRLFYFKDDPWLYLSLALFIIVANDAFDLIMGGTDFFLQKHSLLRTVGGYAWALGIIIYAFNSGQKNKPKA
jgi:hypothetical protein